MSVRDRPLLQQLKYWDGDLFDVGLPNATRQADGVYEAFWVTKVDSYRYLLRQDEDGDVEFDVEQTGKDDVIGYLDHVYFDKDQVIYAKYTDRMEWERMSEATVDERGEPYFTEWGMEYEFEEVTFDRREFVDVVLRLLNGGLVRAGRPDVPEHLYDRKTWHEVPFKVTKKPATPEAWAAFAYNIGLEVVRFGSGGDYLDELPLTQREIDRVMRS